MKLYICLFSIAVLGLTGQSFAGEDEFLATRRRMVEDQIVRRGVTDERTLAAMKKVARHWFVPAALRGAAYWDRPLPIEQGQTISQPFIVAYMTEQGRIGPDDRVLEIGTGSGYQAAILGEIAKEVYTIEIVQKLAEKSSKLLERLGYQNIRVKWGDGYQGWPEHAPFDVILVTAAPPEIPETLLQQLKPGGRMILPVGRHSQELVRITRTADGIVKESLLPVIFVPMVPEKESPRNEPEPARRNP